MSSIPKDRAFKDEKEEVVNFGTTIAGTDKGVVVFRAPFGCEILSAHIVNAATITADNTAYDTFTLTDRGTGAATNTIAQITTKVTGGTVVAAWTPASMGTISATHGILTEGDAVSFDKTHADAGQATTELVVVVRYRRR